ncbi:MAG: hypothetical protein K2Q22_10930, partial [Cytophagales bacterium]|nr:hypothetical protein [Cytophagales bacterium]
MWWYANILTTAAGFNPGYITVDAETRIPRTVVNGKAKVRDTTLCANNNVYGLKGLVTSTGFVGTVSGVWRTFLSKSVAGKFYRDAAGTIEDSSYTGAAFFIPSSTELARDSSKIYLYANNNICPSGALDSLIIRYSPSPQIKITAPTTVCANNSTINLSANLTVAGGLVWGGRRSTGAALTGTFSPPTSLTPTYTLGAGEAPTSAPPNVLIFIATTTGNGKCNPVISTQVAVTVNPAFTVSTPGSTLICATQPNQPLNARISNGITTTTGLWSTNGSGTFSNGLSTTTVLSTTYTFSPNDVANNGVTLSLISTGNGNCNASSGNMVISMYKAPTVVANPGPTVCENNPSAVLSGSATNASATLWTILGSNLGSFSPSPNVLSITYTPSSTQIAINKPLPTSVTLELQASLAGCITAKSQTTVTINRAPTISAGPSQFVCANNPTVTLVGTITPSSTGEGTGATWSGGGGSFFPSSNITSTTTGVTYTLSPAEIA